MIIKISPKFDSSKLQGASIDDRIDVYEDRVRGWLLDSAELLNKHEHAGFGVLHLGFAYFEAASIFLTGKNSKGRSPKAFGEGLEAVFPEIGSLDSTRREDLKSFLYERARCGLFHLGVTRQGILLADDPIPVRVSVDKTTGKIKAVLIDRYGFVRAISDHLSAYVERVRQPHETELRANFEAGWNIVAA